MIDPKIFTEKDNIILNVISGLKVENLEEDELALFTEKELVKLKSISDGFNRKQNNV